MKKTKIEITDAAVSINEIGHLELNGQLDKPDLGDVETVLRFEGKVTFQVNGRKLEGWFMHRTDYHTDQSQTESYGIELDRESYNLLLQLAEKRGAQNTSQPN